MFVSGLHFLVTILRRIIFTAVEYLDDRYKGSLVKSIKKALKLYENQHFNVTTVYMDMEFECLKKKLSMITINITSTREHLPHIEQQIRTIKERMREIYSTLPFTRVPGRMVIELAKYVVLWVNAFPPKIGISKTYSPRTIMTGTTLDYKKHCRLDFGAYAETHNDKEKQTLLWNAWEGLYS